MPSRRSFAPKAPRLSSSILVGETLAFAPEAKDQLLDRFLANCRIEGSELTEAATRYMSEAADAEQFVTRLFNGIRYGDTDLDASHRFPLAALTDSAFDPDTFLSSLLNTAFFTRDPLSVIGGGISLNHMYWHDRNREVDLLQTVAEHHPCFADTPQWFGHDSSFHLEGGDIVNLSGHAVAIGLSSRTESLAIDRLSQGLLWGDGLVCHRCVRDRSAPERQPPASGRLPLSDRRGHLCGASPPARQPRVYRLRRARRRAACASSCSEGLARILGAATRGGPVRLIDFGDGGGPMAFEYGNGAAGILPFAPGNLCVCAENLAANEALVDAGMTVHPVSIQEMTVGFGVPIAGVCPSCARISSVVSIGENIRRLREREGLSQTAFAGRLGVTKETVGRWESGRTFPRRTHLDKMIADFAVCADDIMSEERGLGTAPSAQPADNWPGPETRNDGTGAAEGRRMRSFPCTRRIARATARRCAIPATPARRPTAAARHAGQHLRAHGLSRDDAPLPRRQSPTRRPAGPALQRVHRRGSGGQRHYRRAPLHGGQQHRRAFLDGALTMHPRPTSS